MERLAALRALYEIDRGETLDHVLLEYALLLATGGAPAAFWQSIPREHHQLVFRYLEELKLSSDLEQAMQLLTIEMGSAR
jgi:hypothetical protein